MTEAPRYLTSDEVAERYRTSPATVRYWRYTGTGPRGVKVGRQVLYREDELARWESQLVSPEVSTR